MLNKLALAALALTTSGVSAFAHEQIVDHAHTQSGLIVYAVPATLLFVAAAALGLAIVLTRNPDRTKNKNPKS